ncbi:MAG: hypothetical protein RL141_346 [Candidatus Parcubacteria bacterium]|jgi:predicted alpha/beta hydrolase family esterase
MSRRVFLVHGWGGYPNEGWFPWLKQVLEQDGFTVIAPQLPETNTPHISLWVPALAQAVGVADEETYFVGHSMGCQAIARYIATLPADVRVGGAVFVAGFFKSLTNLEKGEEPAIANEWLSAPINLEGVRDRLPKSVALFSDNDRFVPTENQEAFRDVLKSKIIVKQAMGHFSGSEGTMALPEVREAILEMAGHVS